VIYSNPNVNKEIVIGLYTERLTA